MQSFIFFQLNRNESQQELVPKKIKYDEYDAQNKHYLSSDSKPIYLQSFVIIAMTFGKIL